MNAPQFSIPLMVILNHFKLTDKKEPPALQDPLTFHFNNNSLDSHWMLFKSKLKCVRFYELRIYINRDEWHNNEWVKKGQVNTVNYRSSLYWHSVGLKWLWNLNWELDVPLKVAPQWFGCRRKNITNCCIFLRNWKGHFQLPHPKKPSIHTLWCFEIGLKASNSREGQKQTDVALTKCHVMMCIWFVRNQRWNLEFPSVLSNVKYHFLPQGFSGQIVACEVSVAADNSAKMHEADEMKKPCESAKTGQ